MWKCWTDITMYNAVKTIICFLLCWLRLTHGYNILAIYPQGFRSHFFFNTAILKLLSEAGHEVSFITPFDATVESENFRTLNSTEMDFKSLRITTASQLKSIGTQNRERIGTISQMRTLLEWTAFEELLCYDIIELDEIKNALAGRIHFDVIFAEMMSMQGCYSLLAHALKIPVIGTLPTSPWVSEYLVGNPINPTYIPNAWTHTGNIMTLYDRVKNTVLTGILYLWETCVGALREEIFRRKYFPDTKWTDVEPPALLFLNSHPVLQPRPIVPNAIEIGGVQISPVQPLVKRLQKFIDEAEYGVILMTFGTNNSTQIGDYKEDIFANVFAKIPQRVIWKLEEPYENVTNNVLVTSWVPQRDVLSHRNVKAFISHCGAFGMHEAVHTATPIIGVPLHIDQIHNALMLKELGVAVHLDITTLTEEILLNALNKVINDTRYKENMQQLSNEFNDNPMTAAEKIVYWTEYVIRHKGTPHLKTMGSAMPFYQNLYLDVMVCLVITSTVVLLAVIYTIKLLIAIFATRQDATVLSKKTK